MRAWPEAYRQPIITQRPQPLKLHLSSRFSPLFVFFSVLSRCFSFENALETHHSLFPPPPLSLQTSHPSHFTIARPLASVFGAFSLHGHLRVSFLPSNFSRTRICLTRKQTSYAAQLRVMNSSDDDVPLVGKRKSNGHSKRKFSLVHRVLLPSDMVPFCCQIFLFHF